MIVGRKANNQTNNLAFRRLRLLPTLVKQNPKLNFTNSAKGVNFNKLVRFIQNSVLENQQKWSSFLDFMVCADVGEIGPQALPPRSFSHLYRHTNVPEWTQEKMHFQKLLQSNNLNCTLMTVLNNKHRINLGVFNCTILRKLWRLRFTFLLKRSCFKNVRIAFHIDTGF